MKEKRAEKKNKAKGTERKRERREEETKKKKKRTKDADLFHYEVEFTTLSGYPAKTLSETLSSKLQLNRFKTPKLNLAKTTRLSSAEQN